MPDTATGPLAEEIARKWIAMGQEPLPDPGVFIRSNVRSGAKPSAFAALDSAGDLHIMVEAAAAGPEDDSLAGVSVVHRPLVLDDRETMLLDVTFHGTGLDDVAAQFAASVLDEIWSHSDEIPSLAAIRVLDRWRRFLEMAPRWNVGPAELAPLLAELLVAVDLVNVSRQGIRAWRGNGARHDFLGGTTAIEVKSSLAHTAYKAVIHGIDQLEPPQDGRLFVEFIRLEETPGTGLTVAALVVDLEAAGVEMATLRAILGGPGLAVATSDSARETSFTVKERQLLAVTGDFPRCVPSSFLPGHPSAHVEDVRYRISLDGVVDRALSAQGRSRVFAEVAQGVARGT